MAPMPVMATRRIAYWPAGASAFLAATSLSTPAHISRTLRTVRTSSSGMVISNSFFEREQDLDGVHRVDAQLLELAIDGHGLERECAWRWRSPSARAGSILRT